MRAIYERPNSKFLDMSIRYNSNDRDRLKNFKRVISLSSMSRNTLFKAVYTISCLLVIALAVILLYHFNIRLVEFPAFTRQ